MPPAKAGGEFLFGLLVCHSLFAVSDTLGCRVCNDAYDYKDTEHSVHDFDELGANVCQIQNESKHIGYGLNQQDDCRNNLQPELFVCNTNFPVNIHFNLSSQVITSQD